MKIFVYFCLYLFWEIIVYTPMNMTDCKTRKKLTTKIVLTRLFICPIQLNGHITRISSKTFLEVFQVRYYKKIHEKG